MVFLCFLIVFLCFPIIFQCFLIVFICFPLVFLCFRLVVLCFLIVLLCFPIVFLRSPSLGVCFTSSARFCTRKHTEWETMISSPRSSRSVASGSSFEFPNRRASCRGQRHVLLAVLLSLRRHAEVGCRRWRRLPVKQQRRPAAWRTSSSVPLLSPSSPPTTLRMRV